MHDLSEAFNVSVPPPAGFRREAVGEETVVGKVPVFEEETSSPEDSNVLATIDAANITHRRRETTLLDELSPPEGETGPLLDVVFTVTLESGSVPVKVTGAMIYFALINPNLIAIGLRFKSLSAASREHLTRFVMESQRPKEALADSA